MQNFSVFVKWTLRCNQTNHTHTEPHATTNVESYWSETVICIYNPSRQRSSSKHAQRFVSISDLLEIVLQFGATDTSEDHDSMHAARKKRGTLCLDVCVRCIYICIYIYICIILGSHHQMFGTWIAADGHFFRRGHFALAKLEADEFSVIFLNFLWFFTFPCQFAGCAIWAREGGHSDAEETETE